MNNKHQTYGTPKAMRNLGNGARLKRRVNVRKRKFARVVATGTTQKEAAFAAGYSPSRAEVTGCELMKDPEVKGYLSKLTKKYDLEADRAMRELDKGLKRGRISEHGSYVDKLLRLNGLGKEKEAAPTKNIFIAIAEAKKRGWRSDGES